MTRSSLDNDKALREFDDISIDKDCTKLSGDHDNELFFNCAFNNLNNLTLKNCDLNRSKFLTSSVRDALNFTLTLNCHSFDKVEFSPLLFDLFLVLATKTIGNDKKRDQLLDVVGKERASAISKLLSQIE